MATTSFKLIIQRILQKLINDEGYSQIELFKKFQQLDVDVSRASISNLWNNKSQISLPLLKKAANGLKIVLEREHCLSFNPQTQKFEKLDNCIIRPILQKATTDNTDSPLQSYTIHDGRIDVTDKVSLYNYATYDIIASIADGDTERGLMYLSPYLYGVSRANSPVLEINRKDNKSIYKRYWQSVKALIYSDQISKIV